jgi:hypothetical protein
VVAYGGKQSFFSLAILSVSNTRKRPEADVEIIDYGVVTEFLL